MTHRFLWGAATAAHQVEGNNVASDYWRDELRENGIFTEPSGDACDFYHRYAEDIATLAALGLDSFRFSVEWARIEPAAGRWSHAALDHYARVTEACLAHGVTPVVTLHHFTVPAWFADRGGWDAPEAAERFATYAGRVVARIGDMVEWLCTLNEVNLGSLFEVLGEVTERAAARRGDFRTATGRTAEALLAAHAAARGAIRAERPHAHVGLTLALPDFQAVADGEPRMAAAREVAQDRFLVAARQDDFVGVQTYTRERFGPKGPLGPPEGAALTQMGWELYPEALGAACRHAQEISGRPILVTENGIAASDDAQRVGYIDRALRSLGAAMREGVDVRGYLHWSLLDNFEWHYGYAPTFGLIAVDRRSFARTIKPSARHLGAVAQSHREGDYSLLPISS
jgi:beta-glucosidase